MGLPLDEGLPNPNNIRFKDSRRRRRRRLHLVSPVLYAACRLHPYRTSPQFRCRLLIYLGLPVCVCECEEYENVVPLSEMTL